jgi:hypothetical protein
MTRIIMICLMKPRIWEILLSSNSARNCLASIQRFDNAKTQTRSLDRFSSLPNYGRLFI